MVCCLTTNAGRRGTRGNAATRLDPTRTTGLQKRFWKEMERRFRLLASAVKLLVDTEDAFGLRPIPQYRPLSSRGLAVNARWEFLTDPAKVTEFRTWLKEQTDAKILTTDGTTHEPWTGEFIHSAYRQGHVRAYIDTHKEALAEPLAYAGGREQFLRDSFAQPETLSKVQLIGTRAYGSLKGVTEEMSTQLTRLLADGLAHGEAPDVIARRMTQNIGSLSRVRAKRIARTEVIYAHAEGQLDAFTKLGVDEVGILAEWSTAGDDKVCPLCGAMEGTVLTVEDSHGLIPRHPNCRCTWIPSITSGKSKLNKVQKQQMQESLRESVQVERPKLPRAEARVRTRWLGADRIRDPRPRKVGVARRTKPPVQPTVPVEPYYLQRTQKRIATYLSDPELAVLEENTSPITEGRVARVRERLQAKDTVLEAKRQEVLAVDRKALYAARDAEGEAERYYKEIPGLIPEGWQEGRTAYNERKAKFDAAYKAWDAAKEATVAVERAYRKKVARAIGGGRVTLDVSITTTSEDAAVLLKAEQAEEFLSAIVGERHAVNPLHGSARRMQFNAEIISKRSYYDTKLYMESDAGVSTWIHEAGHGIEELGDVHELAKGFLAHRVGEEVPTLMSKATGITKYDLTEFGREDKFRELLGDNAGWYAGKHYNSYTEIISLGIETLYKEPYRMATRDPEFFKFIVGIVTGEIL